MSDGEKMIWAASYSAALMAGNRPEPPMRRLHLRHRTAHGVAHVPAARTGVDARRRQIDEARASAATDPGHYSEP